MIKPDKKWPYKVKSYKECNENRVSLVEPNGPCPPGSGIIGQIKHPVVWQVNCLCDYALIASIYS